MKGQQQQPQGQGQQQGQGQGQGQQQQREGGTSTKSPKQQQQQYGYYKQKQQQQKEKKKSPWLFSALLGLLPSFALLTATLATIIRFFSGFSVRKPVGHRPGKLLKLYDMEGDPNSRLVREALTMLDLDCIILPCPKGSKRFRDEAMKVGGKEKFPLLVDENMDRKLYGPKNIIPYLYKNYGDGRVPFLLRVPFFTRLSSFFASLVRGFAGIRRQKSVKDVQIEPTSIELWSYEAAPHCRVVREVLTELEIPYVLHNVGKRSSNRRRFVERSGRMMVPYLVDSNTDKGSRGMFESRDIMKYLQKTYGRYGHY